MLRHQIEICGDFSFRRDSVEPIRRSYDLGPSSVVNAVVTRPQNFERRARIETTLGSPANVEIALDRAVFAANELSDLRLLHDLQDARRERAQKISETFAEMARALIDEVEKEEGWEMWLQRLMPSK